MIHTMYHWLRVIQEQQDKLTGKCGIILGLVFGWYVVELEKGTDRKGRDRGKCYNHALWFMMHVSLLYTWIPMDTYHMMEQTGPVACVRWQGNRGNFDSITDRRLLTNEIVEVRAWSLPWVVLRPPRSNGTSGKDIINTCDYGINNTLLLLIQSGCKRKRI